MDQKNTILGVMLLAGAAALVYFTPPPPPVPPAPVAVTAVTPVTAVANADGSPAAAPAPIVNAANAAFAAVALDAAHATVTTLANDFIEVRFTDFGGAIRDVAFKKYPAEIGGTLPFVFNALHADPMLAFVEFPGLDRATGFQLVSKTTTEVVFRAVLGNRLEVTRRYTLSPNIGPTTDPYQLRHETTFRNLTDQPAAPIRVALSLGTAAPSDANDDGLLLTTGYSSNDQHEFIKRGDLEESGGFFGMGAHDAKPFLASPGPVVWTSVENKFFTSILTPDEPAIGLVSRRVKLLSALPDTTRNAYGIVGATQFDVKALAPHGETKLGLNLYVGPKEYKRLSNADVFKADQDRVMEFGFFKFFAQLLITLMNWMHAIIPNWGVAIILTTLALKIVFLPLTLKASKSMKRMAKLQPEMVTLREKFKDNPQKQQAAMMELYKKHKVNPIGGCLPMLLPMPFFIGFFSMLQSCAELRYAPFLWAGDLSAPDTVGHLLGFPINILPLILGATMIVQMRLTPTAPTMDTTQATMMKLMPIIFTVFCYNFSCALSLYSTINGLFTIGQQLLINRMKDEEPAAVEIVSGKSVKNVTPKKK